MTRAQLQPLVLAGLLIICAAIYRRPSARRAASPLGPVQSQPPASSPQDAPAPEGRTSPAEATAKRQLQRARAASLAWNRDPFSQAMGSGQMNGLVLSGILWDPRQPMAVINGQTVHLGEELDGYRIIAIAPDHVSVTDGTQTLQLTLSP